MIVFDKFDAPMRRGAIPMPRRVKNSVSGNNRFLAVCGLGMLAGLPLLPLPANAATDTSVTKPERNIMDPLGIDIADGMYVKTDAHLTIGDPGNGGLSWRYLAGNHSYRGAITEYLSGSNNTTTVKFEGNSTVFIYNSSTSTYQNASGTGGTLVRNAVNSTYTFTDSDGSVYTYAYGLGGGTDGVPAYYSGVLLTVLRPNGLLITINGGGLNANPGTVTTNTGYALKQTTDSGTGVTTIYAVNTLAHTCDASITCDAYDGTISRTTVYNPNAPVGVNSGGNVSQVTDALGGNWQYEVDYTYDLVNKTTGAETFGPKALWYYKTPTGYSATVIYDGAGRITTFTDPRGTYTYTYNGQTESQAAIDFNRSVSLTDPAGSLMYSAYAQYKHATLTWMKDPLNRQTDYNFQLTTVLVSGVGTNNYYRLMSVTKPEGNSLSYVYDARGNVTQTTSTPKSGMGSPIVVYSASYPSTCAYPKTCNQPTWTKDAKGNQTDYTYDNTHGGVLTVTLPVDNNGLRLRTYNTYTAFDTGNGIVYRLTRSDTCGLTSAQLTLTACPTESNGATAAVAMQTSIKMIDYGNATSAPYTYKSSLPYQVTNHDGRVTAPDLQTTTYAYDMIGNVISVDGPLSGTADTSYTTYDANRRKIYEIGPVPGGTGTQKRSLVRHTYNADGQETQTAVGYANNNLTNGSDAVFTSYNRMTYDTAGRLIKQEVISKDVVVP